jgi:hypothetical protein
MVRRRNAAYGEVDARRSELEQIAKVRNNIMHFNNDPLPEGVSSMSSAPV